MSKGKQARGLILGAAVDVVQRDGAGHLTIDAVAQTASLSKGGVLYHFPNKRALLAAMLDQLLESTADRIRKHLKEPGALPAMATIAAQSGVDDRAISLAILAAAAEDPVLLAPARSFFKEIAQEVIQASPNGDIARLLLVVGEGLRFMEMLNLWPFSKAEMDAMHSYVAKLVADTSGPAD
jgi:AcrR family transcriptional regulator